MSEISDRINIGVADITFTPADSSIPVYAGLTQDGTTFKYEAKLHEIKADQYGDTPLDAVVIGETAEVETKVLDTDKENMSNLTSTAKKEMNGSDIRAVTFGKRAGQRLSNSAGRLQVHPIAAGVGHVDRDIIIYSAYNEPKLELAFKLEEEWVIPCLFKGLPDLTRPEGDQLFRIGPITEYATPQKRVVSFYISPLQPKISTSDTLDMTANAIFEDFSSSDVTEECTWTSSDEAVVTVAEDGTVAAVATGTCVIRAEYIGYSNTTTVEVE